MGEAGDQTGSDWIGYVGHYDGDGGRGALRGTSRGRTVHDDQFDLVLDQLGNQLRYSIVIAVSVPPLDYYIASLGVSGVQ
jgi:hypothetical protein